MGQLEGKVCLVTGGLSGIGRAIGVLFAREGGRVVLFDTRPVSRDDGLEGNELVKTLPNGGAFCMGDVRRADDVERAFGLTESEFGWVDVLVNCAGISMFKRIGDLTVEDFDRTMEINVRGTFLCCQRALRSMAEQSRRGVIVNVASNFAFVGTSEASAYCASKGAVVALTRAIAVEVAPIGVRVNALCPGATATELNRAHRGRADVREDWRRRTPLDMGREQFLALPEEIALAALFLAGDNSIYMTGSSLVVDGGWNAE